MKRIIRGLSLILCLAFLLQSLTFAASDKPSSWAQAEVNAAIQEGLIPEELQQNYTQPISRGAVAQMFVNLLERSSGKTSEQLLAENGAALNPDAFSDTNDQAVLVCNALGLINGVGNRRFDPNGTLTRSQIAAIMNRAAHVLGFSTDNYPHGFTDTKGNWVDGELGWVKHVGIISGVGNNRFNPEGQLTTEQAILITYRALKSTMEVVWRKVKETQTNLGEDGKAVSTTVFTWDYDEHGNNTTSKRETTEDGSVYGWDVSCTFNEYGDILTCRGVVHGYYDYDNTYTYYEDGNIQTLTHTGVGESRYTSSVSYEYDSAGRVICETEDDGDSRRYEYDAYGNLTKSGRIDRYQRESWTIYHNEYDQAGHLTKHYTKNDNENGFFQTCEYTYEGDNLITLTWFYGYGDEEYWRETTSYSNFDSHGNPCHIEKTTKYPSGNKEVTYSDITDYEYEYEPVKKASLPFHWAGACSAIYDNSIG